MYGYRFPAMLYPVMSALLALMAIGLALRSGSPETEVPKALLLVALFTAFPYLAFKLGMRAARWAERGARGPIEKEPYARRAGAVEAALSDWKSAWVSLILWPKAALRAPRKQ